MSEIENRQTQIVDEEIIDDEEIQLSSEETNIRSEVEVSEDTDTQKREEIKEELFELLKHAFIEEKRLLGRFYEFSTEHSHFEYDETGENSDEGDDILRKANKIRDKLLAAIEQRNMIVFEEVETNTLTNMISFYMDREGEKFRIIVEVLENSFNLEVI